MEENLVFGYTFRVIDQVSQNAPKIRKQINLLATSVERLRKRSDGLKADGLTQFASRATATASAANRLNRSSRALATGLSMLNRRSRSAGSGIRVLHSSMSGLTGARLFSVLRRSVRGVTNALMDAIKIGADFDRQLAFSAQVMGATSKETAMLRAEAKRLGATTSFTARDSARGFLVLGQAGYNTKESIDLLGPSMRLAGAGMVTLEKATQVASDAIKVYKYGTQDATKVTDILTAGFTSSSQSLLQLQDGLRQAGPVASAAGRSLRETVAVLGLMANQGFRGAKGGVALRNILAQIQTPNKNLERALRFLNLSMADLSPRTNDLATIFKRLAPLASRADLTFKLFGKRTAPAFLAAINAGSGALAEIEKKMGSAKTAAEIYAQLMDTAAGRMDIFKSAVEALKIELFDAIKPKVKDDLKDMTGLVNSVQRVIKRAGPLVRAVFGVIGDTFRFTGRIVAQTFGLMGGAFDKLAQQGKMSKRSINDVVGPLVLAVTVIKLQVLNFIEGFVIGLKKGFVAAGTAIYPFVAIVWRVLISVGQMVGFFDKGSNHARMLGKTLGWVIGVFTVFATAKLALLIPNFIIGSALSFIGALNKLVLAIYTRLIPAEGAATASTWSLNAAFAANPVGVIVLGIVALVGIVAIAINYWETWTAWIRQTGVWFDALIITVAAFTGPIGWVIGAAVLLIKYWAPLKAFFSSLWTGFKTEFKDAVDFVTGIWNFTGQVLKEAWESTVGFITGAWRRGFGWITRQLNVWIDDLRHFLGLIARIPGVGAVARAALSALKARGQDVTAAQQTLAKKEPQSLADKFIAKRNTPKLGLTAPPTFKAKPTTDLKLPAQPKLPTFKLPARPGAPLSKPTLSSNPVQAQSQANMAAQSSQGSGGSAKTIHHWNFSQGAITINTQGKDAEAIARELLPVLKRLEDDMERRGV